MARRVRARGDFIHLASSSLTFSFSPRASSDCKWFSFTGVVVGFAVLGAYAIILTSTLLWIRFCGNTNKVTPSPTGSPEEVDEWKNLTYKEKIKAKKQQQAMEAHGSLTEGLLSA